MNPLALAIFLTIALFVILFAAASSLDTVLFGHAFPYLLALASVASAALLTVALRQIVHLWRQVLRGKFGARLRMRLALQLITMAVIPALVLYGVSLFFVVRAIDAWFDVRVEKALEAAEQLSRHAFDTQIARLLAEAEWLKREWLRLGTDHEAEVLERFREQLQLDGMALLGAHGKLIAFASGEPGWPERELATQAEWQFARKQGVSHRLVEEASRTWVRAVVWLRAEEERFLVLLRRVPLGVEQAINEIQSARVEYALIAEGRDALKRLYLVVLSVAVLAALVAAMMLALHLARRFVAPLMALAEGTRQIAEGDLKPLASRVGAESFDELGVLVRSFDRMVHELQRAREEERQSHAEVAAAKRFLEMVLAHLTTAVLVFDEAMRLTHINEAALRLLGDELGSGLNKPLPVWRESGELTRRLAELMQVATASTTFEFADAVSGKTFLVHLAPMSAPNGWVVVVDDISDVLLAQRLTAWGEIARRLAHEIKNPLTPIRLAAERLQHKLAEMLPAKERQLLERATATIIAQVQAMTEMVNAFRDYARLPSARRERLDLAELVSSVLVLYEGDHRVQLSFECEGSGPWCIEGDAAQLRQVLHNLLQNALDATAQAAVPEIALRLRRDTEVIMLSVEDNGVGFPEGFLQRAFEPYYTTKSKGTGLGLAVVKKIIDEHQAKILLQQRGKGQGAVVVLLFQAAGDHEHGESTHR